MVLNFGYCPMYGTLSVSNSLFKFWINNIFLVYFLDTLHVQQKIPHCEDTKASQNKSPKRDNFQVMLHNDSVVMGEALGTGLQNEVGEYNCFLNVIIQVGVTFHIPNFFFILSICQMLSD